MRIYILNFPYKWPSGLRSTSLRPGDPLLVRCSAACGWPVRDRFGQGHRLAHAFVVVPVGVLIHFRDEAVRPCDTSERMAQFRWQCLVYERHRCHVARYERLEPGPIQEPDHALRDVLRPTGRSAA